jgi:hypothetical protein
VSATWTKPQAVFATNATSTTSESGLITLQLSF